MSKYIDADKLIERLEEMKRAEYENCGGVNSKTGALQEVQELIDSLQPEQPNKYETALEKAREWMPNVNQGGHAILIDIFPELGEGLDPRYGGRKQEQPEVDLEKEIKFFLTDAIKMNKGQWRGEYHIGEIGIRAIAHRFYKLGLNARK